MDIFIIILIIILILIIFYFDYNKEKFMNYAPADIILYDTLPDNNPSLYYNYIKRNPDFYWYNPLDYWINPYVPYYWKTHPEGHRNIQYTTPIYNNNIHFRHYKHNKLNSHFR